MAHQVLITGSTGMIGKGVLLECLSSNEIKKVFVVNRSSVGITHPKLEEILLKDFADIASIKNKVGGITACFHCMGISAMGLSEAQYTAITYQVTASLADMCFELNPNMTFIYVSGQGTSEQGRQMWARVKGRTENYVLAKGFAKALMFRPGGIIPENGIKSRTPLYNFIYALARPFFPLLRNSTNITSTTKMGQAMINSLSRKVAWTHLENPQINQLAL